MVTNQVEHNTIPRGKRICGGRSRRKYLGLRLRNEYEKIDKEHTSAMGIFVLSRGLHGRMLGNYVIHRPQEYLQLRINPSLLGLLGVPIAANGELWHMLYQETGYLCALFHYKIMRKRRLAGFPIDLHELCPGGQFFWRVLLELDISTDNSLKKMDLDEFRTLFESSGVDIWTVIDMAITVASLDYCKEFKVRRDDIVARLYATTSRCYNCDTDSARLSAPEIKPKHESRIMEESREREGRDAGETQNSPRKLGDLDGSQGNLVVMKIKELLDSDQPQETLIELLQRLLSMHISVETLKETEIGRQVLELRKHSSNEIRKLVKRVLGKWRDLVDEWCIFSGGVAVAATIGSDCNGDKMNVETDSKGKRVKQTFESCDNSTRASDQASHEYAQLNGVDIEIREGQAKQKPPVLKSGLTQNMTVCEQLASVKEQLEEKHQEVQNGKRQRTTQVMELRNHPKELLTCWNIVFDSLLKPKGNELFK